MRVAPIWKPLAPKRLRQAQVDFSVQRIGDLVVLVPDLVLVRRVDTVAMIGGR